MEFISKCDRENLIRQRSAERFSEEVHAILAECDKELRRCADRIIEMRVDHNKGDAAKEAVRRINELNRGWQASVRYDAEGTRDDRDRVSNAQTYVIAIE